MEIHGKETSISELLEGSNLRNNFHRERVKGIYLSDSQVQILEKYQIPYLTCHNMKELLFLVENAFHSCMNNEEEEELDELSQQLSEFCYYHDFFH